MGGEGAAFEVDAFAGVEKGVTPPNVNPPFAGVEVEEGAAAEPNVKPLEGAGAEEEVEGVNENPPVLGASGSSFFSLSSFFDLPSSPFAIEPNVAPNENPLFGLTGSSFFFSDSFVAGDEGGETLWPNRRGLGLAGGLVSFAGASLGAEGAVMGEVEGFEGAGAEVEVAGVDVEGVDGAGVEATGNLKELFSA